MIQRCSLINKVNGGSFIVSKLSIECEACLSIGLSDSLMHSGNADSSHSFTERYSLFYIRLLGKRKIEGLVGEVVLSALQVRLLIEAYIQMDCKGVFLFQPQEWVATTPGKEIVAHTLKWPSVLLKLCLPTSENNIIILKTN